jgi:hypothetical protein
MRWEALDLLVLWSGEGGSSPKTCQRVTAGKRGGSERRMHPR